MRLKNIEIRTAQVVSTLVLLLSSFSAVAGEPFFQVASNATYGCRRPHGFGLYDEAVRQSFVCWNGPGMSVMGRAYDHTSGQWSAPKTIAPLDYYGKWDYHNYPNMAQSPDGRLVVVWADHCENLQMACAVQPHDLMGPWESRIIAENRNAYPMVITHGEAIYVFYSVDEERAWPYRSFGYIKSTDNGETWSEHVRAIDSEKMDPDHIDEIYAFHFQVEPGTFNRIQMTWVMRGGPNGHNMGGRNAYFAYFIPSTGCWQGADGEDLGEWINFEEMLDHCLIKDTGAYLSGYPVDKIMSSYFSDGTPLVIYNLDGAAQQAVWVDGGWQHKPLSDLSAKSIRRMPDGGLRVLLASSSQTKMEILQLNQKCGNWERVFEADVPYENGADRTWSMSFIDVGRPELDVLMSQIDKGQEKNDYSGRWPVWAVDTRGGE